MMLSAVGDDDRDLAGLRLVRCGPVSARSRSSACGLGGLRRLDRDELELAV
jgi:hypothetical protein